VDAFGGNYDFYASNEDGKSYFAGDVGIGTITPQNKLNVIGDGNFTGLIYGNGSQLIGIDTTETDSLAYNGTLALNSSLDNYYLKSNPFNFYNSSIFDYNDYYLKSNPFNFYNLSNFPYTHLSNFTDNLLWTSEFNATGDSRWAGLGGGDVTKVIAGEGINVDTETGNVTVSGEDATTTNKGIANFNTNYFTVSSGEVSLKNKTSYWSCPGSSFIASLPDINDVNHVGNVVVATVGGISFSSPVFLPQGVTITNAIVYGNAGTGDVLWILKRSVLNDNVPENLAMSLFNTEETEIVNATVDNSKYSYVITTSDTSASDTIYSARITYTTNYD